jgi:hypothetical protein
MLTECGTQFSTTSPTMKVALDSLPGDDPYDVKFNSNLGLRTIELNRPKKLNALDGSMARKILPRMQVRRYFTVRIDNRLLGLGLTVVLD